MPVHVTDKLSMYKKQGTETADKIPTIAGALGLIKKVWGTTLKKLQCKIQLSELQETIILGTAYIIQRALRSKGWTRQMRETQLRS